MRRFAACALVLCSLAAAAGAQTPARPARPRPAPARADREKASEAVALYGQANQLVSQERCEEAVPILRRLVTEYPQIGGAAELLSSCLLRLGRAQEAVDFLEGDLAAEPEQFGLIRDLGLAYLDLGRTGDAVAAWRRVLRGDEQHASLYGLVARLEQEAGLYEEALATYREGRRFRNYTEYYSSEIVRLARVLGREEEALEETLRIAGERGSAADADLRGAVALYRESKNRARLEAMVDSAAAAAGERKGPLEVVRAAFLVESGRAGEIERRLFGDGGSGPREQEIYAILMYLARAERERPGEGLGETFAALSSRFVERFPMSVVTPSVLLLMAEEKRAGAPAEALALADRAIAHRLGAGYRERAAILKGKILLDDLHRPEEAVRELGRAPRVEPGRMLETERLRVRALLASRDTAAARMRLAALAADRDSSAAIAGAYGLGALAFRRGAYGESVQLLSAVAEKHPQSEWTNDAIELALEVRAALADGGGALDLYRAAVSARERGERRAALDSLAAIELRYPASALAPRAMFTRGEIEAEAGAFDLARARFAEVSERFPAHELAPRALERLAGLEERESAAAAAERYGTIMERYPHYPFLDRVRERYVALKEAAPR